MQIDPLLYPQPGASEHEMQLREYVENGTGFNEIRAFINSNLVPDEEKDYLLGLACRITL